MRFNLIQRRNTTCDITTLKPFKSFTLVLREIDNEITILPYEANKNHISPLTNTRQINAINDNKLKLCNKLSFNHESFIGTEDAIIINGLQNLNDVITLKNGDKISICLLLKNLPASQGMARPNLFQFVEPNNSGVTTLATF
jgi:hypothetical protein